MLAKRCGDELLEAHRAARTIQVGQVQEGRELVSTEEEPWWAQKGYGHMWSFQWDSVGLGTEDGLGQPHAFGTPTSGLTCVDRGQQQGAHPYLLTCSQERDASECLRPFLALVNLLLTEGDRRETLIFNNFTRFSF